MNAYCFTSVCADGPPSDPSQAWGLLLRTVHQGEVCPESKGSAGLGLTAVVMGGKLRVCEVEVYCTCEVALWVCHALWGERVQEVDDRVDALCTIQYCDSTDTVLMQYCHV